MTATTSARRPIRSMYRTSLFVYSIVRFIVRAIMSIAYRYRVEGSENVPASGPVILVVNHLHLFDPFAVAPAIPRKIMTLAAGKWRGHAIIATFLKLAGVIFVKRGEVDRRALKACLDVLRDDGVLAVAPEGTRARDHQLHRAKPGISYIALHEDAVIVPVAVSGVERLREWLKLRRPTCQVTVGKPFRLPTLPSKPTTAQLQEMADLVMIQIGRCLPERYHGYYAEHIAAAKRGEAKGLAVVPVVP